MQKNITVDVGASVGTNSQFWKAAGSDDLFWLTLEDAGRSMLERMKRTESCTYLRNHYTFSSRINQGRELGCDVYSEDENGNPIYDFPRINNVYKEFVKYGLKPIVEYDFLPDLLSYKPDRLAEKRDEGMSASDMGPKDWVKWAGLLKAFTQNLLDTFGLDEIRTWYFEVWNEPDGWPIEDLQTFFKMYDVFVDAVTSVDDQLRVGGPASHNIYFLRDFFHHVTHGKNHVSGRTGSRVDFISHHIYATSGRWVHEHPLARPTVQKFVQDVLFIQRLIQKYPGLEHVEFHLNEWGVCSNYHRTVDKYPALEYRNNIFSALFFTKLVHLLFAVEDAFQFPISMLLYWGFSFETSTGEFFRGNRDLLTAGGVPKPIQTAHEMLAKLGKQRLLVEGIQPGGSLGVMATRSSEKRFELLVYHFNELDDDNEGDEEVNIFLTNVKTGTVLEANVYYLDSVHHNTYENWKKQGSPRSVDTADVQSLLKAGELKVNKTLTIPEQSGNARLSFKIPKHSMRLYVVEG